MCFLSGRILIFPQKISLYALRHKMKKMIAKSMPNVSRVKACKYQAKKRYKAVRVASPYPIRG